MGSGNGSLSDSVQSAPRQQRDRLAQIVLSVVSPRSRICSLACAGLQPFRREDPCSRARLVGLMFAADVAQREQLADNQPKQAGINKEQTQLCPLRGVGSEHPRVERARGGGYARGNG